ncbi:MAG TPA: FtsK/SpoIIIE domain-containing protein [Acidimicrobiales bacterium]
MHIILDQVELDVTADGSATAADLGQDGWWLDGRFHHPDDPLAVYEGAAVTTTRPPSTPDTAFVLEIVGGLRAGRSYPLHRRDLVIGRAPDCDIVLEDPTVSPHHAVIDAHHRITDLGSVNGTQIIGDLVRFGATQARIRPHRVETRGPGPFNRPPRVPIPAAAPPPTPPRTPDRARSIGVAAIVGPALMGGTLVIVYGDLRFALIAVIGPIVGMLTWLGTKRAARKQRRWHIGAMRAHQRALVDHREKERQRLELVAPDPSVMARHLWARRPDHDDFGLVRLGLRGDMPVVAQAITEQIGIAGDRSAALALARAIVCQVAAHHGPADVRIAVDHDGRGGDWDWTKWLPHRASATATATFTIAVASPESELPAACTTVVRMASDLGDTDEFLACGMDEPTARSFARWLARFEDPEVEPGATLPTTVRLADVQPTAVQPTAAQPTNSVAIGIGTDGVVVEIDLVRDGPHAVIAGTTGSGKSELLRTLIVGLAMRHTPDEMVFVLVDYKGGSAFDECALLPHCVGLVTDLDEHLGQRALQSLEAELRHRERVQRDGGPTPPRLVVVIDEFATLAAELPDFLGALVGIAQRGRSLGMHLVLATQRPSGVVNANIKANANLRIALRVQDAADSIDIIDGPEASSISRDTPGRAYVRRGSSDVVLVQTAISSLPVSKVSRPVRVRAFPSDEPVEIIDGPTELAVAVEQLRDWNGAAPRRPWLPMLPERIDLTDVERDADHDLAEHDLAGDDLIAFALADEPDQQRQVAAGWHPRKGNLALYGMVGSGTSTALRAVVERITGAHIYEIDFGVDAHERHARLMRLLRAELDRRRAAGAIAPLIVTCIDGVGAFLAEHDGIDGTEVTESFHRLFAEGPQFGITFAISADRVNALPLRLSSLVSEKLLFRLADPQDYALVGLRPKEVPPFVPGRAIHSDGNRVVQVGMPRERITSRLIRTMPRQVHLADLPPGAIGLDEDLEPVWLRDPEHLLVTGPPRSGKSTALVTMRDVLRGHVFVDDAANVDAMLLDRPIVAAARTDDVRGGYGHWLREIRKSRSGLLLQPDLHADGDLLSVRLPRRVSTPTRPGLGFLVEHGEARLVQIATAGP